MRYFLLGFIFMVSLSSCNGPEEETAIPDPQPETISCPQLDSLQEEIAAFRQSVAPAKKTEEPEKRISSILTLMDRSARDAGPCNYLSAPLPPDQARFAFVEDLRTWTIRDTFIPGIYYILKLRGDFAGDRETYDLFSEELGRIALENPLCYDRYIRKTPGQRSMLLNTTRFDHEQLSELKSQFRQIDAVPEILEFLDQLKPGMP